jgi:hypothetical protein
LEPEGKGRGEGVNTPSYYRRVLTFVLHFISQSAIQQLKVKVNYNKKQHAIDTFNQNIKFISWEYRVHNPRGMYFDYEFYLFFID